ncbi:MAG: YhbY family RNA-binding protein [Oscillospiraceae bacterium]
MLTSKQRSYLRGLAAKEDTILQIGKDGITENITAALSDALRAHELAEGPRVGKLLLTAREAIERYFERCRAEQVQVIGSKLCSTSATRRTRR